MPVAEPAAVSIQRLRDEYATSDKSDLFELLANVVFGSCVVFRMRLRPRFGEKTNVRFETFCALSNDRLRRNWLSDGDRGAPKKITNDRSDRHRDKRRKQSTDPLETNLAQYFCARKIG